MEDRWLWLGVLHWLSHGSHRSEWTVCENNRIKTVRTHSNSHLCFTWCTYWQWSCRSKLRPMISSYVHVSSSYNDLCHWFMTGFYRAFPMYTRRQHKQMQLIIQTVIPIKMWHFIHMLVFYDIHHTRHEQDSYRRNLHDLSWIKWGFWISNLLKRLHHHHYSDCDEVEIMWVGRRFALGDDAELNPVGPWFDQSSAKNL